MVCMRHCMNLSCLGSTAVIVTVSLMPHMSLMFHQSATVQELYMSHLKKIN